MRLLSLCLVICTFCWIPSATTQTIFVKAGASGTGASWADATGDLSQALANSSAGTQIWVAQGTYTPTACNPCLLADRDQPFTVADGVALYGGFLGTETSLDQRDWENNGTILSGDIDGDGTLANNSHSILYMRNVSSTTIVDGFTISGGSAENVNYDVYTRINSGAGLYNDGSLNGGSSNPTIRNCHFTGHYARGFGGAIMNYGGFGGTSSPRIENCRFEDNESFNNGGAVYNSGVFSGFTASHFIDCSFNNNKANNGGAVYNQGSESGDSRVNFEGCTFLGNEATEWGGAIVDFGNKGICLAQYRDCFFKDNTANLGGAILNDGSFEGLCNPIFTDCEWEDNWAKLGGGGVYSQGPFAGASNPTFNHCTFTGNDTDASGGALYFNGQEGDSHPEITNCTFVFNTAVAYGGGMYNFGKTGHCNPKITNSIFIRNEGQSAGAIYNYGGVNGQSNPTVTNCTFFKNRAVVGPCIYNQAADPTGEVRPVVSNCIFWENIADSGFGLVFQNGYAEPTISHSLVQVNDCSEMNTDNNSSVNCGSGILFNIDPQFVAANVENLHLTENSPALDLGDNASINATRVSVDLDSLGRIQNGVVDLGVYEYIATIYEAPSISQQSSDEQHCEGTSTTLYVVSNGTPPLTYAWEKDGQTIPGATDSTLLLADLMLSDNGEYRCIISSVQNDQATSDAIQLSIDPLLTVALGLEASASEICTGTNVTFTANPTNGGNNPQYQWTRNGQIIMGNTNAINLADLQSDETISCQLTSSEICTIDPIASATAIEITVHPLLEVELSIEASSNQICAGETVTFNAISTNEGITPNYTWYRNGQALSVHAAELSLDDLEDQDQITCELESSEDCVERNPVLSNAITITVNSIPLAPSIYITASDTSICDGDEVIFETVFENGGPNPQFLWYLNGISLGLTDSSINWLVFGTGDQITCEIISSGACAITGPVVSAPITMLVAESLTVEANLSISDTNTCLGAPVEVNLSTQNEGSDPIYRWYINGVENGEEGPSWTWLDPQDGDEIYGVVVSDVECAFDPQGRSETITMEVQDNLSATIDITTTTTSICTGELITIEASFENEGISPNFRWLVNGEDQGVSTAFFNSSSLANGDIVSCELNSSKACLVQNPVISNSLSFSVADLKEASINIDVSNPTICLGDSLSFTAEIVNGGAAPQFQWLLNGLEVGDTGQVFLLRDLPMGTATIRGVLESSERCLLENPVASNIINVEVMNPAECWTTNTEDLSLAEPSYIFPNPSTSGRFSLQVGTHSEQITIRIFDTQGRLLEERKDYVREHTKAQNIVFTYSQKGMLWLQILSDSRVELLPVLLH